MKGIGLLIYGFLCGFISILIYEHIVKRLDVKCRKLLKKLINKMENYLRKIYHNE